MKRKNILITGGAGYIGSVVVKRLLDLGHIVTVLDDLSKGRKENIDDRATFYKINILDFANLEKCLKNKKFDVLMHFAALKDAGESMKKPDIYEDNISGVMNLLKISPKIGIKQFVFSASVAVYGNPKTKIISESHKCEPSNFYGFTKLVGEELLKWNKDLLGLNYIVFRYSNVAGDDGLGYIDPNAKNIFNVISDVLVGKRKFLEIFGSDYDTIDGTGIRDYVHVSDIADAHIKSIDIKGSHVLNLGSKKGYSVLEIMHMFEKISGKKIPHKFIKRRVGDPARVVASFAKASKILSWKPKLDLKSMVESTWMAYNKKQ